MQSFSRRLRTLPVRGGLRCLSTPAEEGSSSSTTSTAVQSSRIQDLANARVQVEKVSLSRGLAMNRFEKDFMIYPEYADTDDVVMISGFASSLRDSLEHSVNGADIEKQLSLTPEVQMALQQNKIYAAGIPAEFGGLGMCRKDLCKIFEELGIDWNIFANLSASGIAANLIILYGTDTQKQKYLPLLADGSARVLITNVETTGSDSVAEVTNCIGTDSHISLSGVPVFGQKDANLAIIFASTKDRNTTGRQVSCYIIDKNELRETDKWTLERTETMGLKAVEAGTLSVSASVGEESLLGETGRGEEVKGELVSGRILPLAASAIGYTKRVLADLAGYCNRTPSNVNSKLMMSSSPSTQRLIADLSLRLYSLESSVYYINGLLDEGIPVVVDVENALILKLTRQVLLETVRCSVEVLGMCSGEVSRQFEKNIRDVTAILGMFTEGDNVEQISVATLSTWSASKPSISGTLKRLLFNEKIESDLKNPKLQHYIAEHAHPSLQLACQELEFSMSRVNAVINKMISEQGKNIAQDFGSIEGLARVLQNHLCMVATISRASRSYAIGLRNADLELAWATVIATRLSRDNWFQLEALSDYFGLMRLNPSVLNAGRAVLDLGGYSIESPIQRNW